MFEQSHSENVFQFCIFCENGLGTGTVLGFKMQAHEFTQNDVFHTAFLPWWYITWLALSIAAELTILWSYHSEISFLLSDSHQLRAHYFICSSVCLWNVLKLCCFSLSRLSQLWWWQLRDQTQMQLPQTRWMISSSILSHFSQMLTGLMNRDF